MLARLIGSKIGVYIALGLLTALIAWSYRRGRQSQRNKALRAELQYFKMELKANNAVTQMSLDQRRAYVRRWMPKP